MIKTILQDFLDSFFQGPNRLFFLPFNNTTENDNEVSTSNTANRVKRDSHRTYFLPRVDIVITSIIGRNVIIFGSFMINYSNYNVLIDGRKIYDQLLIH